MFLLGDREGSAPPRSRAGQKSGWRKYGAGARVSNLLEPRFWTVGSEEARMKRWPPSAAQTARTVFRMQLSRRLRDASAEQARTRRRAASLAAVSSLHYASAGTDAEVIPGQKSACREFYWTDSQRRWP